METDVREKGKTYFSKSLVKYLLLYQFNKNEWDNRAQKILFLEFTDDFF